ncbi:type I-E CRISPR-associated protein Cse2/CasB [Bordetella genomosp. 13]|uniref:type I-E CRISPR-associated protein Cse2/CasB n=1 Tax=Bordetella genomosp. 13 TaxID=463040 RepID=UPI0011A4756A|nr:type I-E CRISPR-associated protein Cse2/CasB [Bordetella genomosp. 13]
MNLPEPQADHHTMEQARTMGEEPFDPIRSLARHVAQMKAGPHNRGEYAALARLDPDAPRPHQLAALTRALIAAGLNPGGNWRPETWRRWSYIAHGMALAGHKEGRLGTQLAEAELAESRVTRLLVARGEALFQLLPRVLRLLASKSVQPNWHELGPLIGASDADSQDSRMTHDSSRRRIAGDYYSTVARSAKRA